MKDKRHQKTYPQTNSAEKKVKEKKTISHWILHIHEIFRYLINVNSPTAARAAVPTAIYGHQLALVLSI